MRLFTALFLLALTASPAFAQAVAAKGPTPPATAEAAAQVATPRPPSFADLADKLLPAVVNISTTQILNDDTGEMPFADMPQFPPGSPFEDFFKDFFDRHGGPPQGGPRRATSLGSGFIIDTSGLIVTNNHVIEDADEITVTLHDNSTLKAEIIGRDGKTDLALLKVKTDKPLTAISWGDSDAMRVGDWVLAIGNPFGLGGSVTAGIISARARDINAGPYDDFIQTDASINRGNSGGPMFNLKGELIGINTAIFSPSGGSVGIGFAIPASMAKNVVMQLKEKGKITRGWIGVRIQQVTDDIAKSLGLPKTIGALVSATTPKSPAAAAGLKSGDIITAFNGREVTEMRRLPRMVAETPVGAKATLKVWRDGKETSTTITIAELPADLDKEKVPDMIDEAPAKTKSEKSDELGLRLAPVTPGVRQKFELPENTRGVVVVEVDADSAAAEKGIAVGDVIIEAGQSAVTDPAQVINVAKAAKKAGRPVLLLVERGGDARFVALTLK
ncbi:MAG: DegQ family serine endoprotease [Bdellovibrionales bacterium]